MLGVAMRAGRGEAYNHKRSGSCRVLMWAQAANAEEDRLTRAASIMVPMSGALSVHIFEKESRCSSAFISLAR